MRGLFAIIARWGLLRCERAATAVEYGLIIAMIVLALIAALSSLANKTTEMWGNVSSNVLAH